MFDNRYIFNEIKIREENLFKVLRRCEDKHDSKITVIPQEKYIALNKFEMLGRRLNQYFETYTKIKRYARKF